jgi:hypothetical protein
MKNIKTYFFLLFLFICSHSQTPIQNMSKEHLSESIKKKINTQITANDFLFLTSPKDTIEEEIIKNTFIEEIKKESEKKKASNIEFLEIDAKEITEENLIQKNKPLILFLKNIDKLNEDQAQKIRPLLNKISEKNQIYALCNTEKYVDQPSISISAINKLSLFFKLKKEISSLKDLTIDTLNENIHNIFIQEIGTKKLLDIIESAEKEEKTISERDYFKQLFLKLHNVDYGNSQKSTDLKLNIAIHEAAHAAMISIKQNNLPLPFISIIPTKNFLGINIRPQDDKEQEYIAEKGKTYLLDQIKIFLAGRTAQEELLGERPLGATQDQIEATNIAKDIINNGLGKSLAIIPEEENTHLWKEVDRILKKEKNSTIAFIKRTKPIIEAIAKELIEKDIILPSRLHEIIYQDKNFQNIILKERNRNNGYKKKFNTMMHKLMYSK